MINLYAYTYPEYEKYKPGYILVKLGDSIRDVDVRMGEQGGAAEAFAKIIVGAWPNCRKIKRDHDVHKVLTARGLHHKEGAGTEWFLIPGSSAEEAFQYLDTLISEMEERKVRRSVVLRQLQQRALDAAMVFIARGLDVATVIANLCPRFGKTIWALMLFNRITAEYGNRVMMLPAYWLSVHSSFIDELEAFDDFTDIALIDPNNPGAQDAADEALAAGQRLLIPISLCGDFEAFKAKHGWVADLNAGTYVFADEGDFGTHADNQVEKMDYLLVNDTSKKLVKVFASGTNVQRLAKGAKRADGVIYTAYSELEATETDIVKRKFYQTHVAGLKAEVEALDEEVQPSWVKLNGKPYGNRAFWTGLFQALVGENPLRPELNLSELTQDDVRCFMMLVSANKAEMAQIKKIAEVAVPNYEVIVLNGDETTNRKAETEVKTKIAIAQREGKEGVIIVANQMGSRSFSVSEIQATVIAYDRGSVDATAQKISRSLTPGVTYTDVKKEFGYIVDLSFDPNRSENIEKLILEEAIQVQRGNNTTFTESVRYVLNSVNMMKVNGYGAAVEVSESDLFAVFGDNEAMLRVADVSVDVAAAMEEGLFDIIENVTAGGKDTKQKKEALGNAKNTVREGETADRKLSDKETKELEKVLNNAIRALNMSATSVWDLAGEGDSYRECLETIGENDPEEFTELYGVSPEQVITLLDRGVLNEPILDVIVQNSASEVDNLFAA